MKQNSKIARAIATKTEELSSLFVEDNIRVLSESEFKAVAGGFRNHLAARNEEEEEEEEG